MYKRRLTILICTLVIVGLLFAPFSVPARALVGIDDALAGGLFLGFLSAMGLDFSFIGIDQSKDNLISIIQDLYNQYRLQHSLEQIAISVAWDSLKNAVFSGGTIQVPNDTASDMIDFTDYLVDTYSITDDSSVTVETFHGCYSVDGTHFVQDGWYECDRVYVFPNGNSFQVDKQGQFTYIIKTLYGYQYYTSGGTGSTPITAWGFPSPNYSPNGHSIAIQRGNGWGGAYLPSVNGERLTFRQIAGVGDYYINLVGSHLSVPSSSISSADGVYVRVPGITDVFGGSIEAAADQMLEAALDEDLESSYEITDEPPVYPTPDGPTILNVFTDQLGSFFDTIWHYVSDLVDYSTPFIIVWRDQLMGAFPFRLMLPLYASFVLALFLGLYKVFRGVH